MISIDFTPEEVAAGQMTAAHLAQAAGALRDDGIVVLNDVVDIDHIAQIRQRMFSDVEEILSHADVPFNWNTGNLQQDPPPIAPYLFRDVLANDLAVQVTHTVLGDGLVNGMYSGNTALPSKNRQPVHADTGQLWPNLEAPTPAYAYVVNVPLVDVDARNGSTEIWPGTHKDPSVVIGHDLKVTPEMLDKWRAVTTPIQPSIRAGSIVIRDIRLWHAGMPNHTDVPRPMIAMIHWVRWWPQGGPLPFAPEAREILDHPVLKTNAKFVDGPIDYLYHNAAYEFEK